MTQQKQGILNRFLNNTRQMKTSIRSHEGRVALVTGAAQGIGQSNSNCVG